MNPAGRPSRRRDDCRSSSIPGDDHPVLSVGGCAQDEAGSAGELDRRVRSETKGVPTRVDWASCRGAGRLRSQDCDGEKVSPKSAGVQKRNRSEDASGSLQDRSSPWAGAPRFSVAGFAVVVAVVAVVSEVVVAVLSEVDVSVSVRINSVRVRLGSPSASVATETTTVLPDLLSNVMGRVSSSSGCQDGPAEETNVGRGSAEDGGNACPYPPSPGLGVACSSSKCVEGLPLTPLPRPSCEGKRSDLGASPDSTSLLPSRAFVHRSRDRLATLTSRRLLFPAGLARSLPRGRPRGVPRSGISERTWRRRGLGCESGWSFG